MSWKLVSEVVAREERRRVSLEQSMESLLAASRELVGAATGTVVVTARCGEPSLLDGWRPIWFHSLRSKSVPKGLVIRMTKLLEWLPGVDLPELEVELGRSGAIQISADSYPDGSHRRLARWLGVRHRMMVQCPVDDERMVLLLLDRGADSAFADEDVAVGQVLAHRLEPLARRWCAELGVTDGVVLTPRERQVQRCLAEGLSEAEGAEILGLRPASFHQVVVRLYRRRSVSHRGELLSRLLWPDEGPTAELRPVDMGIRD